MSLKFQLEKWTAIRPELEPLLYGQWMELGSYRDLVPMDMNWEQYAQTEEMGMLAVVTARDGSKLVGWYVNFLMPHQHYRTTLYGFLDMFYLLPEYRMGLNGIAFFAAMEEQMRKLSVQCLISISKAKKPVDEIFERLGWEFQGKTYIKALL